MSSDNTIDDELRKVFLANTEKILTEFSGVLPVVHQNCCSLSLEDVPYDNAVAAVNLAFVSGVMAANGVSVEKIRFSYID